MSQPRQVLDAGGVGPVEADPGLLDGIVRLAQRAEHAVGHGAQVAPVLLELLGLVVHSLSLLFPLGLASTQ